MSIHVYIHRRVRRHIDDKTLQCFGLVVRLKPTVVSKLVTVDRLPSNSWPRWLFSVSCQLMTSPASPLATPSPSSSRSSCPSSASVVARLSRCSTQRASQLFRLFQLRRVFYRTVTGRSTAPDGPRRSGMSLEASQLEVGHKSVLFQLQFSEVISHQLIRADWP